MKKSKRNCDHSECLKKKGVGMFLLCMLGTIVLTGFTGICVYVIPKDPVAFNDTIISLILLFVVATTSMCTLCTFIAGCMGLRDDEFW